MKKYYEANVIELVYSGQDYFEVLDAIINESVNSLYLQTYIFNIDETGLKVVDALKRASARGVEVYLLVDAYGSFPFPLDVAEDLRNFGVNLRLFSPLLSSESIFFGRRLHHKIVVADKKVALVGGINIANKYNEFKDAPAWLDYAVLIKGEVNEYLYFLCERFHKKLRPSLPDRWESKRRLMEHKVPKGQGYVRFRRNDWIRNQNEVYRSYIESLIKAEKKVIIVASYFLPGSTFRKRLKEAAKRGVEIQIIMSGKSDVTSASFAQYYLYDFYLESNIKLYEWNNSVMHGKAMIIDDTWATIGSFNLNFLSHYVSVELNVDVISDPFVRKFSNHLTEIIDTCCVPVSLGDERRRAGLYKRFIMWLAYNFYKFLQVIALTGKKYRRERKKR
jgi:cardiolipin synthase A/B